MPLDYDDVAAARERINSHLGKAPNDPLLDAHDLHMLLMQDTPDQVRLDALTYLGHLRQELDRVERDLIEDLRVDEEREAVSWTRIGRALGVTRQGAEGRFLRLQGLPGHRSVRQGRERLARQAETDADLRRRARARWGRYAVAERAWVVRLRVRRHDGAEDEVAAQGPAGRLPRLAVWRRTSAVEFVSHDRIAEVLEVLHETTPWKDVAAPESLAGLPGT